MNKLTELLFENQDIEYKRFSEKLIPDTKRPIIGVRVPKLKQIVLFALKHGYAKSFIEEEHVYYEEFFLHGLIISKLAKNTEEAINCLENFLLFIDNWAICDSTSAAMKIFKKKPQIVLKQLKIWVKSNKVYTARFAIVCLMNYFLSENFNAEILDLITSPTIDDYYVNMAIAWALSVGLIKQYDMTIKILENKTLPKFIQNKTIQKAMESFRIPIQSKNYLKTLKIK